VFTDAEGPIEHFSWGKFIVRGIEHSQDDAGQTAGEGKDICINGDVVSEWHERKGHTLTKYMVQAAIDSQPDILIIG